MDKIFKEAEKYIVNKNVEIFRQHWDEDSVDFEMDKIKGIKSQSTTGYGLRIIKDDKLGFTSSTEGVEPSSLVRQAVETVKYGPKAVFEFPGKAPVESDIRITDDRIRNLTVEKMTETGEEILDYLKSKKPEYQYSISLNRSEETRAIKTGNFESSYNRSAYSFSVNAHSFREGDFFIIGDYFDCSVYEPREKEIADRLLDILKFTEGSAVIGTGTYPILVSPWALMDIIRPLKVGLNGTYIEKGSSPLAEKMEQKILPETINIYDDPSIEGRASSTPFDDEGVTAERRPLIEKGVIKNFILDQRTAGALKMQSTGNGSRGYTDMPYPSVHCLFFEQGNDSLNDLIKGIKEGLFIQQTIGGSGVNPFTGDFQINAYIAVKIENGQLAGRTKGVMIGGNMYKIFETTSGISSERIWHGNACLPYVRFDEVFVSGNK
jgi:PmbA protein